MKNRSTARVSTSLFRGPGTSASVLSFELWDTAIADLDEGHLWMLVVAVPGLSETVGRRTEWRASDPLWLSSRHTPSLSEPFRFRVRIRSLSQLESQKK